MILEKFFPKKGVDGNLTKLSSKSVMMRNGWIFDVDYTNGEDYNEKNENYRENAKKNIKNNKKTEKTQKTSKNLKKQKKH